MIARAHAHALHTLNHLGLRERPVRLVVIAGRRREAVAASASALGFERWTTEVEEVVADPEVEVVANLGSNDVHCLPSIAALELGKNVLCEKPLARTSGEARTMVDAAESSGATSCVAYNYRSVPAVRLAREIVAAGRLGRLRHLRALYLQDWAGSPSVPRSWRFEEAQRNGAVADYSHIVDLLRFFAGEPKGLTAHTARFIEERPSPDGSGALLPVEVEDAYAAAFELEGGAMATLEASRCATGWKGRQVLELNGSDGSLWWNMEDVNRLHVFFAADEQEGVGGFRDVLVTQPGHPYQDTWWGPGHVLGWEHSFVHLWRDFLAAVEEGRPSPPGQAGFGDGWRAIAICEAILDAAGTGTRIELSAEQEAHRSATG
jgi:predicted dehydrogenase